MFALLAAVLFWSIDPRVGSRVAITLILVLSCSTQPREHASIAQRPSGAEAKDFVLRTNQELKKLYTDWSRAEWIKSTYITHDSEILAAQAHEKVMEHASEAIRTSMRFSGLELDADTARQLKLLRLSSPLPAPHDPNKRTRLAELAGKMTSLYGAGKYCQGDRCQTLGELSQIIAEKPRYQDKLNAWRNWRTISTEMRPLFEEFVSLANEGAREIGFDDLSILWKSGYDMTPEAFARETDRLWAQVRPLYEALHCHVRARLSQRYGSDKVPPQGKIPAHLLGNMWAQEWAHIYPLLEPYRNQSSINVTRALKKKRYRPTDMVRLAEGFFTSLGLKPLPESFWERSLFVKPRDRDVVCHASAWDVTYENDLRIKMCIKIDEEDLITTHHELGHNYYFMYYHSLPVLYQAGAHDGFHEGVGDTLALSVTPGYLKNIGILPRVSNSKRRSLIYK